MEERGARARWMYVRWSWRDLRSHWVAVVAIALVMAIGVGVYAGLGSTSAWRRLSNDASFAASRMHDFRVALSPGTYAAEGDLLAGVAAMDDARAVSGVEERLVVDGQLEVATEDGGVLVAARLVGMDLDAAEVDRVWVRDGTVPDAGAPAAVLEAKFADFWSLPPTGTVELAAGTAIRYTGLGVAPEDFFYEGPEGSVLSQGQLAPLYLPLAEAQHALGSDGLVNDVVLTVAPGADRVAIGEQLQAMVDEIGLSATVSTRADAPAVRVLYEDIDNDQRFWNAIAALVLVAAALAAFNLVNRIVEAQRREIGIGMALGVGRWRLAQRPLLVGAQVAVLGTIAGVGVGYLMGEAMGDLLRSFLPLPEYRTPFRFDVYARGAVLGLAIPVLAAAVPVWNAVRVEPIRAIRTGHLTARSSRPTDWTGRLPIPGSSSTLMPIRNVVRTPRRSVLTALGVGAAITALVAVLAMLDSFGRTIDDMGRELVGDESGQVLVQLDTFHPVDDDVVAAIAAAPSVETVDPGLRLPSSVSNGAGTSDPLDVLIEIIDLHGERWVPTVSSVVETREPMIVLAEKAARDLDVEPGDTVVIRHPLRVRDGSFRIAESSFVVGGTHPNPLRVFAYVDAAQADRFGLAGLANAARVYPAAGATAADVQRELFGRTGVSSSQEVARVASAFDDALEQFVGFLVIASGAVLALALLIAFNASRITVEERRREHATMRAFGMPVRTIVGMVVKESVLVGIAATVVGLVAGVVFLDWMLGSLAATTLPELGIARHVSPSTILVAAAVGIVAVALAPLFLVRRVSRMDIPDTLRIME